VARDIASVADKDIREDSGAPDAVLPPDGPRSEGGPATQDPERTAPGETAQPAATEIPSDSGPTADLPYAPPTEAETPAPDEALLPGPEQEPSPAREVSGNERPAVAAGFDDRVADFEEPASFAEDSVAPSMDPEALPVDRASAALEPAPIADDSMPLDVSDDRRETFTSELGGSFPDIDEAASHVEGPSAPIAEPEDAVAAPASFESMPESAPTVEKAAADESVPPDESAPNEEAFEAGTGVSDTWRSAIADALAERQDAGSPDPIEPAAYAPEETEPEPAAAHPETSAGLVEHEAGGAREGAAPEPPSQPAGVPPPEAESASFTLAAQDLFRPPAIEEEPHLITLGRRLEPALRIPRPVPPDIVPRPEPAVAQDPWWKTTPWTDHLRTAARYAAYALGGYLALVLVLILLFRFVNPPGSMLMLTQLLTGTAIDRTWVPLPSISSHLVRAVIVSEDGRFCEHSGVDTAAIKEAIDRAARGTPRGASTISMQVTKNLFLWSAKSYVRKVIEIPLTLFMEVVWPKRRILEVYLNIAEWGPGVFGAEAAAQHHFRKSAARLSEREAALLAAVLPNPVVRNAGSPSQGTSARARVVQARVKAYGAVASCVSGFAAVPGSSPAAAKVKAQPARKAPPRPAPRKKQPADDWAPVLNFGSP
jgi:monofunctional biosynthetic peptidoglycan transglycosylase